MKKYFLAFDLYNKDINKFYFGVVSMDLGVRHLAEIAKEIISDNFPDISPEDVTIKITALNNIEL